MNSTEAKNWLLRYAPFDVLKFLEGLGVELIHPRNDLKPSYCCEHCGRDANALEGGNWLSRLNPGEVPSRWKCQTCNHASVANEPDLGQWLGPIGVKTLEDVQSPKVCRICGNPATCYGQYEDQPEGYACSDCCGHWNEDGHCEPIFENDPGVATAPRALDAEKT